MAGFQREATMATRFPFPDIPASRTFTRGILADFGLRRGEGVPKMPSMALKVPPARIVFTPEQRREILARIDEQLQSGQLTLGKYGKEFEAAFAKACGRAHAVAVSSGTSSIEIPAAAGRLARGGRFHAVVAVGCVLEGGTPHFALVTEACARGLAALSAEGRVGVGMGVLSCHTLDQAMARSATRGRGAPNRGAEAAEAALEMAALLGKLP